MKFKFRFTSKTILNITIALAALFLTSQAHAYGILHEYNYRSRTPASSIAYLSQQVFGNKSTVQSSDGMLSEQLSSSDFRGFALQSSFGLEHWRFLQTGLTYSLLQSSFGSSRSTTFQGHEFGAEGKVVLSSPVFNVGLGGAYFGVSKTLLSNLSQNSGASDGSSYVGLSGTGQRVQIDFSYFFSPRLSWTLTAMMQQEKLSSASSSAVKDVNLKTYRGGAGLNVWFL